MHQPLSLLPRVSVAVMTAFALVAATGRADAACGDTVVDVGEQCDGGPCCLPDCTFATSAVTCRAAVNASCDVAETCSGSDAACPEDTLAGCGDTDGLACTVPTCTSNGDCVEQDYCKEICRGSGFWGTHSGDERNGSDISGDILGATGPMMICGQPVSSSDLLGVTTSVVEAVCVNTEGSGERQLFRELVTASLNCALSEGGSCDQVTGRLIDVSFDACNTLCASELAGDGDTAGDGSPTEAECIEQLRCFNRGGRVIDGKCALGTCDSDATRYCGADYGSCDNAATTTTTMEAGGIDQPGGSGGDGGDGSGIDDGGSGGNDDGSGNSGDNGHNGNGPGDRGPKPDHHGKPGLNTRASDNANHENSHGRNDNGGGSGNGSGGGDSGDGGGDTGGDVPGTGSGGGLDAGGVPIDDSGCLSFVGNCAAQSLCNLTSESPVGICPDRLRASSAKACRAARQNDCTIDSCD